MFPCGSAPAVAVPEASWKNAANVAAIVAAAPETGSETAGRFAMRVPGPWVEGLCNAATNRRHGPVADVSAAVAPLAPVPAAVEVPGTDPVRHGKAKPRTS